MNRFWYFKQCNILCLITAVHIQTCTHKRSRWKCALTHRLRSNCKALQFRNFSANFFKLFLKWNAHTVNCCKTHTHRNESLALSLVIHSGAHTPCTYRYLIRRQKALSSIACTDFNEWLCRDFPLIRSCRVLAAAVGARNYVVIWVLRHTLRFTSNSKQREGSFIFQPPHIPSLCQCHMCVHVCVSLGEEKERAKARGTERKSESERERVRSAFVPFLPLQKRHRLGHTECNTL